MAGRSNRRGESSKEDYEDMDTGDTGHQEQAESTRSPSHKIRSTDYDSRSGVNTRSGVSRRDFALEDQTSSAAYGNWYAHDQMQSQQLTFRSEQASKEMVYKVYSNVIGALEELERRENLQRKMQRSHVQYADLSKRGDEDVKSQVDTQLLLFEVQIQKCNRNIRSGVRDELKRSTLNWMSTRRELPKSTIDDYAMKLFQILNEGRTIHSEDLYQTPSISDREMKEVFGLIGKGHHDKRSLDESFRKDPNKKAQQPYIRGESTSDGAKRLGGIYPNMKSALEEYIAEDIK